MDNKKINYKFFYWGPFLYKTTLNEEEIQKIKNLCNKKGEDVRAKLAGLMNQEYKLNRKKIFKIIAPYLQSYLQAYVEHYGKFVSPKIELTSAWVNYMTKYESNPLHHHEEDLSFVLFLNVPEKLEEEYKTRKSTSKPGVINFMNKLQEDDMYLNSHSFFPRVGDFYIFPANLPHYVNGFSCDGERISVSGNVKFHTPKKKKLNG
tara:strand:- start:3495 stop:4109 length:615 start_codon:yes stop_codon:yes gene_type:complete